MPNPSNIERDELSSMAERIEAQLAKNTVTLEQQHQLAKENAPAGGGYVCLKRKRGNDTWEFALATRDSVEAYSWYEAQTIHSARVLQVKADGDVFVRSAK